MKSPFRILTLGIFILLFVPPLLMDGMFMDGQQYACVARNLANGKGSFWFPHLSETWSRAGLSSFMEHPPLIYALQGSFFSVFGESRFVERGFQLLIALLSGWLIVLCWRLLVRKYNTLRDLEWLPILLWAITPVVAWTYHHNVHETTMGLFTLAAVYCCLRGVLENKSRTIPWIILCGLSVFAASLSKGVPGLFPLVSVGCLWLSSLVYRGDTEVDSWQRGFSLPNALGYSLLVLGAAAIPYLLLMQYPPAAESLTFYVNERLLARVGNEPTVSNRFYTLERLISELLPAIGLCVACWLGYRFVGRGEDQSAKSTFRLKGELLFCLLMGVAGSLPLMLTGVQRGFYIAPALPFFALALALTIAPYVTQLQSRLRQRQLRAVKFVGFAILFTALVLSVRAPFHQKRDKAELADTYLYGQQIERGSVVGTESAMYDDWGFIFYMLRYFELSTMPTDNPTESRVEYFIDDPRTDFTPPAEYFEAVFNDGTAKEARYRLFRRK